VTYFVFSGHVKGPVTNSTVTVRYFRQRRNREIFVILDIVRFRGDRSISQNRKATVLPPYGNRLVFVRRPYDAAYDGFRATMPMANSRNITPR